jgi:hypothetical protein
MKKLLLFSAILAGGVAASQAGINLNVGFGLPGLPRVVVNRPVVTVAPDCEEAAPVAVDPYCAPAPVVVAPAPYCEPSVVIDRRPVIVNERFAYNGRGYHNGGRLERRDYGHDSHDRGHGHNRR